jgi:hypothetical protein
MASSLRGTPGQRRYRKAPSAARPRRRPWRPGPVTPGSTSRKGRADRARANPARREVPNNPPLHQPVVPGPPATPRTHLDHEWREERPLLIRHQTMNQGRSPQRTSLESAISRLGILFLNRALWAG